MSKYETVIGLEIHAQLKTDSKMFCACDNDAEGKGVNTTTCPLCMGMPGVLPVTNKKAMEWTVLFGLALNCEVVEQFNFERKQYFYPDLPKAYQITSQTTPPLIGGYLDIDIDGDSKRFTLEHIHIEEDAGKLIHKGKDSYVDLNRAGTPLMEIVTNPVFSSPQEAKAFLQELRMILRYLGVSSADMEKGQMRADANISLRPIGQKELGKKVEVKNMNSFVAMEKAMEYEMGRQSELLDNGEGDKIIQETRGWDENNGVTTSQRSKEEANDYRYFPEPDIPPVTLHKVFNIEELKSQIPELPREKRSRYMSDFKLSEKDVYTIASDRGLAEYFEEAIIGQDEGVIKKISNWILGEVLRHLNENNVPISEFTTVEPGELRKLVLMIEDGKITGKIAKDVLIEMIKTGAEAEEIVKKKGIKQVSDEGKLKEIIQGVLDTNPKVVEDYKGGKTEALGFFIGQVMVATKGQANPGIAKKILEDLLK